MFDTLLAMQVVDAPNPLSGISRSSIAYEILDLLSDFARASRYFNLDSLSATQPQIDPLERWNKVFDRVLSSDVSEKKIWRILEQAHAMGSVLARQSFVFAHSLSKTPMDHAQMLATQQLHDAAAPYAVYHLSTLIEPLRTLLSGVTDNARALSTNDAVPVMSDFFQWFWLDKPSILRKQKWP
ncbi:MAG TPA: hypothetical protein PLR25_13400 [Planctomycetaceae bacterium]|nr:hypothetical protein [Planctomycetaceae bacterium]